MTLYPVLLLPLLALAMVVFLPLFTKDSTLSTSFRSRRRRRIMLGRLAVVVLPVAALATWVWPFQGLNSLLQGALLSAGVLLPACLVHWIISLRLADQRNAPSTVDITAKPRNIVNSSKPGEDIPPANRPTHEQAQPTMVSDDPSASVIDLTRASTGSRAPLSTAPADFISLHQRRAPTRSAAAQSSISSDPERARHSLTRQADLSAQGIDTDSTVSPLEVHEQLERVSELVRSYDLSEPEFTASDEADAWSSIRETHDKQSALSTDLIGEDVSETNLSSLTIAEVTERVIQLRKDKNRLQRLVIAQHAAIESERQAHDQSRMVARDAIKIMRDSRHAQKLAEKVARRERAERQRIELQYKKVAHALDNALSIIDSKKRSRASASATPTNGRERDGGVVDDILA